MSADGAPRSKWPLAVAGVVLALVVTVLAVVYRAVVGEDDAPQFAPVQVAEGFPPVLPPSFEGPSASAAPSPRPPKLSPPSSRKPSQSPGPAPATPISGYSACSNGRVVLFTATFGEEFAYRHVFIDTDADARTGYTVREAPNGFGADYMIENDVLYRSTGADWSWAEVEGITPLTGVTGLTHRWQLQPGYGVGDVIFNGSGGGTTAEQFTPAIPVRGC
ncbi:hypothetical protein SAMN05421541_119106 [Actinoplanes philippinensis]|uniref:Uncharacterized protein n=1 Tax=Actinoplanes philippinensis TaxID=35752 RepID=A0A1I2L0C0_9ACTN|nr:hypothetical protein [Actinoplanes philippinensis]SFF72655.1 hypothetical protein SAMN05421541_119106 [Actinoplanes philippinensis]